LNGIILETDVTLKAMPSLTCNFRRVHDTKRGQSLVEYTLIVSFISLSSVVLLTVMGVQMSGLYTAFVNGVAVLCAGL
jgi:Flp pilus assembly pilin Flp